MSDRKVKFNIKNAHYALMTVDDSTGAITYGDPVAIPGTTSLSLDVDGDQEIFWADGIKYFIDNANNGYTGDWSLAYIPDTFRKAVLQEVEDAAGVLFEVKENYDPVHFAFGFQIDGNDHDTRFWFYDCTAARPKIEASTTEGRRTPQTDTLTLTMEGAPVKDGDDRHFVRAKCLSTATGDTYEDWFDDVVLPGTFGTAAAGSGSGSGSGSGTGRTG